jgi:hypothetical protein
MPLLAVGLGAVAAGTAMQMAGNAKSARAIAAERAKFGRQEQDLENRAGSVFQQSADQNGRPAAQAMMDQGAAARQAIAGALKMSAANSGGTGLPANQPQYQVTGDPMQAAAVRANTAGNSWSNVVGGATSRLGGYGDLATRQSIGNQQADANLNIIGDKARGNARLLPIELEVAGHAGDKLSGWGQIVSALGSVASLGAASGLGAGAAAPAAAGGSWNAATDAWTAAQGAALQPSAWSQALAGAVPLR